MTSAPTSTTCPEASWPMRMGNSPPAPVEPCTSLAADLAALIYFDVLRPLTRGTGNPVDQLAVYFNTTAFISFTFLLYAIPKLRNRSGRRAFGGLP
jgi:hypothetical protein